MSVPSATGSLEQLIARLRHELPRLSAEHAVQSLAIFGSYVRSEQNAASDLDILVTFAEIPGLIKYIALEQHLSDMLGLPVDLVMESALRPQIRARIEQELQRI